MPLALSKTNQRIAEICEKEIDETQTLLGFARAIKHIRRNKELPSSTLDIKPYWGGKRNGNISLLSKSYKPLVGFVLIEVKQK